MTTCPACQEEIRPDAKKCPHCQHVLDPDDPIFGAPVKSGSITLTIDSTLMRVGGFLVMILGLFGIIAASFYGVSIDQARQRILEIQEDLQAKREDVVTAIADADRQIAELSQKRDEVEQIRSELERLVGNDPSAQGEESDPDTITLPGLQARTDELDQRVSRIEQELRDMRAASIEVLSATNVDQKSISQIPYPLTREEKQKIAKSIEVVQNAQNTQAPEGGKTSYSWRTITFTVEPKREIDRRIEKVVYAFDPKWWSDPRKVVVDARNNFAYSVRVWGSTKVEIEVYVDGFRKPLRTEVRMMSGEGMMQADLEIDQTEFDD